MDNHFTILFGSVTITMYQVNKIIKVGEKWRLARYCGVDKLLPVCYNDIVIIKLGGVRH